MLVRYFGHSCFSVEVKGKKLLFDPFISKNELASAIDVNLIEADYILLSHGHFDHLADTADIALRTGATIICNWEIHEWYNNQGIKSTHPMNTGGKWTFDFGSVKMVVAHHSSGLPDGSYGGNPAGFVIKSDEGNFYYSGDTALTLDMQLIPSFAVLKFAVFPVGDRLTMGLEDAVKAAQMVSCQKILGVHYNTWDIIKIDRQEAKDYFSRNGLELFLPEIGETINI